MCKKSVPDYGKVRCMCGCSCMHFADSAGSADSAEDCSRTVSSVCTGCTVRSDYCRGSAVRSARTGCSVRILQNTGWFSGTDVVLLFTPDALTFSFAS